MNFPPFFSLFLLTVFKFSSAWAAGPIFDLSHACKGGGEFYQYAALRQDAVREVEVSFRKKVMDLKFSQAKSTDEIWTDFQRQIGQILKEEPEVSLFLRNPLSRKSQNYLQQSHPLARQAYLHALEHSALFENTVYEVVNQSAVGARSFYTPETVQSRANALIARYQQKIAHEPSWDLSLKREVSRRLTAVKILTFSSVARMKDEEARGRALVQMGRQCGSAPSASAYFILNEGAKFNHLPGGRKAVVSSAEVTPALLICPSLLYTLLPLQDRAFALDFILSHEIAHLFLMDPTTQIYDADENVVSFAYENASMMDKMEPYLNCVQKSKGSDLLGLVQLANRARSLPGSLSEAEVNSLSKFFEAKHARVPNRIDLHASEVLADAWARRILEPELNLETLLRPAEAVGGFFPLLCELETDSGSRRDAEDDGVHPSAAFRVAEFFEHAGFQFKFAHGFTQEKACD